MAFIKVFSLTDKFQPMKMHLRTALVFLLIFFLNSESYSQQTYAVSWGNTTYDTLTNTTSILVDVLQSPILYNQEADIAFGFSFPFFDSTYTSITLNGDGGAYFPDAQDYNFFLFSGEFENHLLSGLPIFSDWRFKQDSVSGVKVLKVEWRNVGIMDDVTDAIPTNHRINFQTWFYENGIIELHFGEIDLANSSFYSDTAGFIWSDGESYGPYIGIANNDFSKVYYVTGSINNPSIVLFDDSTAILQGIPPLGKYFRFAPNSVSEIGRVGKGDGNQFTVFPNPFHNSANIKYTLSESALVSLTVYNALGQTVTEMPLTMQNKGNHLLNLENRNDAPGIYFVELVVNGNRYHTPIMHK